MNFGEALQWFEKHPDEFKSKMLGRGKTCSHSLVDGSGNRYRAEGDSNGFSSFARVDGKPVKLSDMMKLELFEPTYPSLNSSLLRWESEGGGIERLNETGDRNCHYWTIRDDIDGMAYQSLLEEYAARKAKYESGQ